LSCDIPFDRISAYLDGELDSATTAAFERHLERCADCSRELANLEILRRGLLAAELRGTASDALRARLQVAPAAPAHASVAVAARAQSNGRWLRAWALAATLALVAVGAFDAGRWWSTREAPSNFTEAVVSSHLRALLGEHLVDVPSSDRHTVKPWFAGKLEFAPHVLDLADADFPLRGGRLEILAGRRAAALVYQSDRHVITLVAWPSTAAASTGAREEELHGLQIAHWQGGGFEYWAVSDVERARLAEFVRRWRARDAG